MMRKQSMAMKFLKRFGWLLLLFIGLFACAPRLTLTPTSIPVIATSTIARNAMWTEIPATTTPTPIVTSTSTRQPITKDMPPSLLHHGLSIYPTPIPFMGIWDPACAMMGGTCIWWVLGLGKVTNLEQSNVAQAVIEDAYYALYHSRENARDAIELLLLDLPYHTAEDNLFTMIAADNAPDIVGPVSWYHANHFPAQILDLHSYIANDPEIIDGIDPRLVDLYKTSNGQISVPFALYPSAVFYNTTLFDKAGLAYPPSDYGSALSPASYQLDGKTVEWNWETIREVARRLTLDANRRNATEASFDSGHIIQYGFTWGYETQPSYLGTFWGNGAYTATDGETAQLPEPWKASWSWTYDGMWGARPFIPNGVISDNIAYDQGNPFNSGKVAMTIQPSWYLCCLDLLKTWEIGALPAYQGKVSGRMDADFFVMLKGTRNPNEAFKALTYLMTTGTQKLLLGSPQMPPAYNGIPARASDQVIWLERQKVSFPWVKHWDLLLAGLALPDSPHAEAYMPNFEKSWDRGQRFYNLLANTAGLDLNQEETAFLADLQALFDEKMH